MERLALLLLTVAACAGDHTLGTINDLNNKCCYDSSSGQKLASCDGLSSSCACRAELCDKGAVCTVDKDCPQLGLACQGCADGTTACPSVACVSGQCKATITQCPAAQCKADSECPVPLSCQMCPSTGGCAMYTAACVNGKCQTSAPTCPTGMCTSAAQCAVPQLCKSCSDGSTVCAKARCDSGQCSTYFDSCPTPTGCTMDSQCPQPGAPCQKCSDGSAACPRGYCDQGTCKAVFPQCPPPQCTSDAQCPAVGAPCKLCSDGTSSCPEDHCLNGSCQISWTSCGSGANVKAQLTGSATNDCHLAQQGDVSTFDGKLALSNSGTTTVKITSTNVAIGQFLDPSAKSPVLAQFQIDAFALALAPGQSMTVAIHKQAGTLSSPSGSSSSCASIPCMHDLVVSVPYVVNGLAPAVNASTASFQLPCLP